MASEPLRISLGDERREDHTVRIEMDGALVYQGTYTAHVPPDVV